MKIPKKQINTRIDTTILENAKEVAKIENKSFGNVIEIALEKYIKKIKRKHKIKIYKY